MHPAVFYYIDCDDRWRQLGLCQSFPLRRFAPYIWCVVSFSQAYLLDGWPHITAFLSPTRPPHPLVLFFLGKWDLDNKMLLHLLTFLGIDRSFIWMQGGGSSAAKEVCSHHCPLVHGGGGLCRCRQRWYRTILSHCLLTLIWCTSEPSRNTPYLSM